jgi:HxlR-like helix-turn-helix protein
LQRVLPGISTEQLRSRLNRMVADGLLTRQRYREVPPRVDYELTERSRELLPVLGALARWGYDWTWSSPRSGEDINVGAIFRLAPGLLTPSEDVIGVVDLVVSAEGEDPELRFRLSASGGQASISERSFDGRADATVTGSRSEWVRALGPEGSVDDVDVRGDSALADELLGAFVRAAQHRAAVRAA